MSNESGFTCPYCAMHSTGHDFSDLHSGCTFTCKECQCESVIAPMTKDDYVAIAGIEAPADAIQEARKAFHTLLSLVESDAIFENRDLPAHEYAAIVGGAKSAAWQALYAMSEKAGGK